MGQDDLAQRRQQLLAAVPETGDTISNKRLREKLGWDLETYQAVKETLVHDETLEVGRGRGGTVSRTKAAVIAPQKDEHSADEPSRRKVERKLYPRFLDALRKWAADQGWTDHLVEQLAHQGRRNTGGNWTRPDFVVVGYKKYEYTPGVVRDVETFELKLANCGIDAVFEAAAHSRIATKSYLAIEAGDDDVARIESECQRFGVGLFRFPDNGDPDNWEWLVEAVRREPDPEYLEQFIRDQVQGKERLRKWLR